VLTGHCTGSFTCDQVSQLFVFLCLRVCVIVFVFARLRLFFCVVVVLCFCVFVFFCVCVFVLFVVKIVGCNGVCVFFCVVLFLCFSVFVFLCCLL